jgi:LemA protein
MSLIVIAIGMGLFAIVFITLYNGMIAKKNAVETAFSGIDVQLKKRYDLIPNLVESARAYMQHEKEVLERLVELRGRALSSQPGSGENLRANADLTAALRQFSVAVEAYPQLRAVESFTTLQRSLNEVEEQLAAARRFFNAAVNDYNNAIEQIPTSFFAALLGYRQRALFEASAEERERVSVGALFQR